MQFSFPILFFSMRFAQLGFSVLVLALTANTLAAFSISASGFGLFVALWTLLYSGAAIVLPLTSARLSPSPTRSIGILIAEAFAMFLNFISFIVQAAINGPGSCSGSYAYDYGLGYQGTIHYSAGSWCGTAKAAIAFAALTWCTFVVTLVIMYRSRAYIYAALFPTSSYFDESALNAVDLTGTSAAAADAGTADEAGTAAAVADVEAGPEQVQTNAGSSTVIDTAEAKYPLTTFEDDMPAMHESVNNESDLGEPVLTDTAGVPAEPELSEK
ncbi:membrane-associating domain-containing protein [Lipomyces oligophaga]|uniref:membrane-associating domain-containing protein n=1 Tax=Lipomyces oligophaga TaxID=45792 RepID=UPI0034CE79D2